MELVGNFIDLFLHLDEHLSVVIQNYGTWTYALLFLIIFLETGVVVTPFLPGDSLIFAAGTFAGLGDLNIWVLFLLLSLAAVVGDTANYWIGHYIGPRAFSGNIRFLKKEYLDRTHEFYERHGARLSSGLLRPDHPHLVSFVAGTADVYFHFITYNFVGACLGGNLLLPWLLSGSGIRSEYRS
jgi:membrane-associated protein